MLSDSTLLSQSLRRYRDQSQGWSGPDVPYRLSKTRRCLYLPLRAVGDDAEVHVAVGPGGPASVGSEEIHSVNRPDTAHSFEAPSQDVTLIAEARRFKADLIVMGAYGHSRVREWLWGGATYTVLHKAPIPLLIAH